jgi:hypothetical protein
LAHPPDRADAHHGLNPLDYHRKAYSGEARNFAKRIPLKSLNAVFGNLQDLRVYWIRKIGWHGGQIHVGLI